MPPAGRHRTVYIRRVTCQHGYNARFRRICSAPRASAASCFTGATDWPVSRSALFDLEFSSILPGIGQNPCRTSAQAVMMGGVPGPLPYGDLVDHLSRTCVLSPAEAARVVADVLGYFSEPPDAFVRRRHRELKARGLTNDLAFAQIAAEVPQRRYAPPELSLRQLRRIVYG